LALAAIYVGATRSDAAKIGGAELQIIWEWVFALQGLRGPRRAAEWQCAGAARLAVRIQPYYDPTMVIVTAAH
jgi:hypothetical protein